MVHIQRAIESLGISDIVLDGELYNHDYRDKFEELTSFIRDAKVKPGAEVVGAGRANPANRSGWRFMRGTSTGSSLDIQPTSQSGTLHMSWNDANSGRVILLGARGFGGKASHNAPFTRLDG